MVFEERLFQERPGVTSPAAGRDFFSLRVAEEPNGDPVLMPVMAVHGDRPGPTVLATACLHGNEILGAEVVRRVALSLDPAAMSGSFVGIPTVNVPAVNTRTRASVVEQYPGPLDMNRVFPPDANGLVSQRIAHLLLERFVPRSDWVIDLHNASVGGQWLPYAIAPPREHCPSADVHRRTDRLAAALAFAVVLEESIPGAFFAAAVDAGTPATLLEFGVANTIDPGMRALGIRAVTNTLRLAGILGGEPVPNGEQVRVGGLHRMSASRGGYLEHHVDLGSWVEPGQLLAETQDLSGETVERFEAPAAGVVCRRSTMGIVGTGDLVVYVGAPARRSGDGSGDG